MAPRRLLLVGEGNFSFAVAVSETLDPSTSLTATCLQRPADLTPDPVARENLQRLRERAVQMFLQKKEKSMWHCVEDKVGLLLIIPQENGTTVGKWLPWQLWGDSF
uniref:25S rRNA (uridine-N(3))-methyltransferase BMT5-like domain-containing protein n=1 Tax=Molossus molossus TaxID=27622 RepID=A0A7J8ERG4_MOLMO|nr:hypothetical protein HJG59_008631 [Molossus molossus]